jgi:hypothetical protein
MAGQSFSARLGWPWHEFHRPHCHPCAWRVFGLDPLDSFRKEHVLLQLKLLPWAGGLLELEVEETDFLKLYKEDLAQTLRDMTVRRLGS